MALDARLLQTDRLTADVCVVGGGPAGLVLAAELAAHGVDVLLLESGGSDQAASVQDLNRGAVLGDPYAGLEVTRQRAVGGTTAIWNTNVGGRVGAKYVPLDAVDLEPRRDGLPTGWPFRIAEIAPYFSAALARCGFRGWKVGPGGLEGDDLPALPDLPMPLVPGRYLLASRDALLAEPLAALGSAGDPADPPRLLSHATVLGLHASPGGTRVERAAVGLPGGRTLTVNAETFVLAAGAVENARLLLLSREDVPSLHEVEAWLGRGFMEHPRDASIRLRPGGRHPDDWLDEHPHGDGTSVLGRLGLHASVVRSVGLNASATVLARRQPWSAAVGRRLGRLNRPALRRLLGRPGHGWSRHPRPSAVFDGFTVLLNLEQTPHPDDRIVLGSGHDAFGQPRTELHWRWRERDAPQRIEIRRIYVDALREMGFDVVVDPSVEPDANAHHHAGTTRMSTTAADGVVHPDGAVHGTEGLYVTGASVFPTCGYANPLLTIVALSLRLADHLAG